MGDDRAAVTRSDIDMLGAALEAAWTAETSVYDLDEWSDDNPAYGQCAATAAVVQDYLGGDIVNAYVDVPGEDDPVSHYFNDIDGVVVDFTAQQFPDDATIPRGTPKPKDHDTTRAYVLSYDATRERYEALADRVEDTLLESF